MPFTLDWIALGANGSSTLVDGTDSVGVTATTDINSAGQTAVGNSQGNPTAPGLWVNGITEPVTTTLTFDDPVENFNFEVFDIDSGGTWDDKLTFIVTDAQGNAVPITFSDLETYASVSGGNVLNAEGSASSSVETSGALDSVTVAIAGPISAITFIFDNGESNSSSGTFGISNMTFDPATPDYIVEGTAGDDTIDASYAGDPEGDDVDNNDNLAGTNADSIEAGAGNDNISSGLGDDTIDAGIGNDTVFAGSGNDSVLGGDGNDTVFGFGDNDTILGGTGNDSLDGDSGSDSLDGGAGEDTLIGDDGDDTLLGGADDDEIYVSSGANFIDGGSGDDLVFGGSDAETIFGGTGNDALSAGAGADSVEGGDGNDSINGAAGNDTLIGGAGDDTLDGGDDSNRVFGEAGDDVIRSAGDNSLLDGGADADFIEIGIGDNDTIVGGETVSLGGTDSDTLSGLSADDTLLIELTGNEAGTYSDDDGDDGTFSGIEAFELTLGNDTIDGRLATTAGMSVEAEAGDDSLYGGGGADTLLGQSGDDRFLLSDGFGADTITGGESGETAGDTLDLSLLSDAVRVDLTSADAEAGTVFDGSDTASFSEIETIALGGAIETLILANGSGADTVSGFSAPADNGDGTFTGADQLDVAALDDAGGSPVTVDDVTVTDTVGDGSGDAILSFPNGESLTLTGVPVSAVSTDAQLVAMGIPAIPPNYIVEGTSGADTIDAGYTGDPEGDMVDAGDNLAGNDDDSITAGGGDDSVLSGAGADTVYGEAGADTIDTGDGADLIYGGDGTEGPTGPTTDDDDVIYGAAGDDTIYGNAGHDSLYGNEDNDSIIGGSGDDTVEGGTGNDTVIGGTGDDSINGDFGNDSIVGGAGDDWLRGSYGEDTIVGGTGDDTLWGGFNDDLLIVDADFGNYDIQGESDAETNGDVMDVSAVTKALVWDLTQANPENGSFTDGINVAQYNDIETIILGSGTNTLTLATFGGSDSVTGFTAPTDLGGGLYSANDLLDVSALTDFDGNPTHTGTVTVGDTVGDGSGDAVLTFGNGATLTLVGVDPADVSSPAQLIAMGIPEGPDGFVDGTAGDDSIDAAYTGDPNFDRVDNDDAIDPGVGSNDDTIRAFGGNDTVDGGAGDDLLQLGTGDDTGLGGAGNDTIEGGAGNDSLIGGLGDDTLSGGADDDTLNGQIGDDLLSGNDGSDTFELEDDYGNDTVVGGEVDDASGDVLDFSGVGGVQTWDLTDANAETGSVTDDTSTLAFSEIEQIVLSGGTDILTLSDTSGSDTVNNFTAPVLAGDGSYIGFDQIDVSTMLDGNGAFVNTGDVTVTDTNGDGTGDTILTFPSGTSLTLTGVLPSAFAAPEALAAIGIPLADYIVEGTGGADLIDSSYLGDPEYDLVDANDAEDGSDADTIEGYGGNDTIFAGDGGDYVDGGEDDDLINGMAGEDTLVGGLGNDSIAAGADNDSVIAGDGNDTINGGSGNDTIEGGAGNDLMSGAGGDDELYGGAGNDTFLAFNGFGDDLVFGGETGPDSDTLSVAGVSAEGVEILFGGDESGTITGDITGDEISFEGIETLVATGDNDTITATADTLGTNIDAGGGNDIITGGAGSDTLSGGTGNDTLSGGLGGDDITGGTGDDTVNVAQGDTVTGGDGDDFFNLVDLGETDTGTITITGGEGDETDGDTLALNGLHDASTLVINTPDTDPGGNSGTVTLLDGTVVNFFNIENIICFVPGTHIATPGGARKIETLKVGDPVLTQDNGIRRIRWIGKSTVQAKGNFAPVRFDQYVFHGATADLVVSPQHRMLFKGYEAELLFGEAEVLVPALHLVDGASVTRETGDTVTYIHMMFDEHEIVFAEGVATESFHPGTLGVDSLAPQARDELFSLFPHLRSDLSQFGPSARTTLKAREAQLIRTL
jgi:Ca2+-binding RTX toxin-like protein